TGRQLARQVAAAVQEPGHPMGMTVRDVIELGRYPHHGDLGRTTEADHAAVAAAARTAGVDHLLERDLGQLSGGERQRAHVARAIAQQAGVLLLDEPTNHLDIAHQFSLLSTLRGLADDQGTAVALALHDLGHAARYCDAVAVLADGLLHAFGAPRDVLTPELTRTVFGVEAHWEASGRLALEPIAER
ncbi:MAG: ABC transporter ATP-binding protein, partial [Gemmobacter sp.]